MKTKKKPKSNVLYLREIHPDAKRQFKSTVVRRDDTMSQVVEALLRFYVKNPDVIADELVLVKLSRR